MLWLQPLTGQGFSATYDFLSCVQFRSLESEKIETSIGEDRRGATVPYRVAAL